MATRMEDISAGGDTMENAAAITSIVLSCSSKISMIGLGISKFQFFLNIATEGKVTASTEDFLEV